MGALHIIETVAVSPVTRRQKELHRPFTEGRKSGLMKPCHKWQAIGTTYINGDEKVFHPGEQPGKFPCTFLIVCKSNVSHFFPLQAGKASYTKP